MVKSYVRSVFALILLSAGLAAAVGQPFPAGNIVCTGVTDANEIIEVTILSTGQHPGPNGIGTMASDVRIGGDQSRYQIQCHLTGGWYDRLQCFSDKGTSAKLGIELHDSLKDSEETQGKTFVPDGTRADFYFKVGGFFSSVNIQEVLTCRQAK